ncbi:MAG: hypothetical protein KBF97_06060 [Bacteroidetes bacterium]|nr:hypothetical protein [Bacteroidota bacterium]
MEILIISALSIGVLHAMAPDHWLPFVVLGKAQQWNGWKTTRVVSLAGLGHVGSSVLITLVGLALGAALEHVNGWEELRADYASMLLIGFGAAYAVWGVYHWKQHTHEHSEHHTHVHDGNKAAVVSYWTLFALIVFGPCEPLIPLLFASVSYGWMAVASIFLVFGVVTIAMMLLQVHLALLGLSMVRFHFLKDASHIIAGVVIVLTGIAIRVLGI